MNYHIILGRNLTSLSPPLPGVGSVGILKVTLDVLVKQINKTFTTIYVNKFYKYFLQKPIYLKHIDTFIIFFTKFFIGKMITYDKIFDAKLRNFIYFVKIGLIATSIFVLASFLSVRISLDDFCLFF